MTDHANQQESMNDPKALFAPELTDRLDVQADAILRAADGKASEARQHIDELLGTYHAFRAEADRLDLMLRGMRRDFAAQTADLEQARNAAKADAEQYRQEILKWALRSGEKRPHDQVEMKTFRELHISDEWKAFVWLLQFAPALLTVDHKRLETALKDKTLAMPPDVAEVIDVPRLFIFQP